MPNPPPPDEGPLPPLDSSLNPLPPAGEDGGVPPNNLDELAQRLAAFRQEIKHTREKIKSETFTYEDIKKDDAYELLAKGEAFVNDEEHDFSQYPYHVSQRRNREVTEPNPDEGKKTIGRVVKLKDFEEPTDIPITQRRVAERPDAPNFWVKTARQRALEALRNRRKDLESYVFENILQILGIVVLSIGLVWLVRLGITTDTLPEPGRVLVGILAAGLMAWGAKANFFKNETISILFATAALGLLYYTAHLSYGDYRLHDSRPLALFFFVLIVAGALGLTLVYNRIYFALLALLGVYLAPYLLRTDRPDYALLFGYLLVMDTGMLAVAYLKQWPNLAWYVLLATTGFFGYWLLANTGQLGSERYFVIGFLFATLFFLLFFLWSVVQGLRPQIGPEGEAQPRPLSYSMFYLNLLTYALAGFRLLKSSYLHHDYLGLFLLGISGLHAMYAAIFFQQSVRDDRLLRHLVRLAAWGLLIGAPLQIGWQPVWLTLFFAVASVGFLWLAGLGKLQILRDLTVAALVASLVAVAGAAVDEYGNYLGDFFFNPLGLAVAGLMGALVLLMLLLARRPKTENLFTFTTERLLGFCGAWLLALPLIFGNFELAYKKIFVAPAQVLFMVGFNTVFAVVLALVAETRHITALRRSSFIAVWVAIGAYFWFAAPATWALLENYLRAPSPSLQNILTLRYLLVGLGLLGLFLIGRWEYQRQIRLATQASEADEPTDNTLAPFRPNYSLWVVNISVVAYLSLEFAYLTVPTLANGPGQMDTILQNTFLFGFTVLWALAALAFLAAGFWYNLLDWRLFSAFLFIGLLVKFAVYDFYRINLPARVFSILFIGGLLIGLSQIFQRLKHLRFDRTTGLPGLWEQLAARPQTPPPSPNPPEAE
ncbi:MAG: DUF2339 domain-containing protein [Bernardetiaceae bacterium]|nr:DUF2339 domain-containing protein [Bernardetiaceae bacterium]